MANIIIEDAYYCCCGEKFRDKTLLRDHQLADLEAHRSQIERVIHQHDLMWQRLKQEESAIKMREWLDNESRRIS